MKRPRLAYIYFDSLGGGRFCSHGSHGSARGTGPLVPRRRPLSLCWVAGVAFRGAEINFVSFISRAPLENILNMQICSVFCFALQFQSQPKDVVSFILVIVEVAVNSHETLKASQLHMNTNLNNQSVK